MFLQVEHRKKDFKKTWKLESGNKPFSLGHSKYADIRLDQKHPGISGVIEFKNGCWRFTHLTRPNETKQNRMIEIQGPVVIPLSDGELHVLPFDHKVNLFSNSNQATTNTSNDRIWLIWSRNDRIWYSEYQNLDQIKYWPHQKKPLNLQPKHEWQYLESDGIKLSYKLADPPEIKGLHTGAFKGLFDPSLRPFMVGALIACLIVGLLPILFSKPTVNLAVSNKNQQGTLIHLDPKPPVQKPPTPPKNAVAKALAQAQAPITTSSPKPSAKKTLGKVFSQIGRHSLKAISAGSGPKTISISSSVTPNSPSASAKSFKILGSLGSGTGLNPSQFTKGLKKDGGVGLGDGTLGGSQLGQISQGNIGQGDLGLLHKESEISGGLDRDVIAKYITSQKGKILYCYERQLSANPGLFGKVSVKFQIAPGGEVDTSNIIESTLGNTSVESCLMQLISQWKFPKPEGGVRVLVTYPFVFKSIQ